MAHEVPRGRAAPAPAGAATRQAVFTGIIRACFALEHYSLWLESVRFEYTYPVQRRAKDSKHLQLSDDDLAQALQALRRKRGFSQEELADESGYHRTYISQLERGLKSPSLRTLGNLARVLGLSTSDLVKEVESEAERRLAQTTKPGGKTK